MQKTNIEWVKNPDNKTQGYTWNPITGCLNGCSYCYARQLCEGRLSKRILNHKTGKGVSCYKGIVYEYGNAHIPPFKVPPFWPHYWPERLESLPTVSAIGNKEYQRRLLLEGKGIFLCSLGELFGDWIPRSWQSEIFWRIRGNPQHRFYLLTKQPQNLVKFSPFPDNCWVGVTATDYEMFSEASMQLGQIEAKVKYISFEPLLGWTDYKTLHTRIWMNNIDWLIIGSQTRPYNPPKIEWVKEIVEAADKVGVPVFLKNNLYDLIVANKHYEPFWSKTWVGRLRQEFPTGR